MRSEVKALSRVLRSKYYVSRDIEVIWVRDDLPLEASSFINGLLGELAIFANVSTIGNLHVKLLENFE